MHSMMKPAHALFLSLLALGLDSCRSASHDELRPMRISLRMALDDEIVELLTTRLKQHTQYPSAIELLLSFGEQWPSADKCLRTLGYKPVVSLSDFGRDPTQDGSHYRAVVRFLLQPVHLPCTNFNEVDAELWEKGIPHGWDMAMRSWLIVAECDKDRILGQLQAELNPPPSRSALEMLQEADPKK